MEGLTDEQVFALDKILIKDNGKIIGLHFESGYYGRGGSNGSPYTEQINTDRLLDALDGKPLTEMFGLYVCAVVNDIVYLVKPTSAGKKVISFGANGKYDEEYGIAYDTMGCFAIRPILK